MKKIAVLCVLVFSILSCKKKEVLFSESMIEKLIVQDNEIPSMYSSLDLYVKTNEDKILLTHNHYLFFLFEKYYHKEFETFNTFLDEVLNNDFVIDQNEFKDVLLDGFKLNTTIENEYSELGFEKFLKKYSITTNSKFSDFEFNKSALTCNGQFLTVSYFLYLNNYDVSEDCIIGTNYIRKREKSFR